MRIRICSLLLIMLALLTSCGNKVPDGQAEFVQPEYGWSVRYHTDGSVGPTGHNLRAIGYDKDNVRIFMTCYDVQHEEQSVGHYHFETAEEAVNLVLPAKLYNTVRQVAAGTIVDDSDMKYEVVDDTRVNWSAELQIRNHEPNYRTNHPPFS